APPAIALTLPPTNRRRFSPRAAGQLPGFLPHSTASPSCRPSCPKSFSKTASRRSQNFSIHKSDLPAEGEQEVDRLAFGDRAHAHRLAKPARCPEQTMISPARARAGEHVEHAAKSCDGRRMRRRGDPHRDRHDLGIEGLGDPVRPLGEHTSVEDFESTSWPPNDVAAMPAGIDAATELASAALHLVIRREQPMEATRTRAVRARERNAVAVILEPL